MDIHKWMNPIEHIRRRVFRVTQVEMAKIAGVRQATISRWEAGLTDPSLKHLKRIRAEARKRRLAWDDRLLLGEGSRAA